MVRSLTLVAIKRLTRHVRADGNASTHGIQQALGMFNLVELMVHVDHDTKYGRWDKKDAELVLTSMHLGAVGADRDV